MGLAHWPLPQHSDHQQRTPPCTSSRAAHTPLVEGGGGGETGEGGRENVESSFNRLLRGFLISSQQGPFSLQSRINLSRLRGREEEEGEKDDEEEKEEETCDSK